MPYVKPTLHISRIAGTALKTFTHGYAQTVTALAAQNHNSSTPLADTLVGRFRKTEKSKVGNVYHNVDLVRQASTSAAPVPSSSVARPETSHGIDAGLDKYFSAWQKHQRQPTRDWQQFQFARTIEWQPPSVLPGKGKAAVESATAEEVQERKNEDLKAPLLKRSYTTSALDSFGKAFIHDEAAEAVALEQVNNAIAEEIQKSKDDAEALVLKTQSASSVSDPSASIPSDQHSVESPATIYTPTSSFTSTVPDSEAFTQELQQLADNKRYHEIPGVFQTMLRAGVQKPAPSAYRALLTSAIELTHDKHQRVPKALEVYSDMLRRKVVPDIPTFGIFINLLAKRATDAATMRKGLEERLSRYGGLEEPGKFMFGSSQTEHTMLVEDSSLGIALKMFDRAASQVAEDVLPSEACASLLTACAEQGRMDEMSRVYDHMTSKSMEPQSTIYPPMIVAFGQTGDLRRAVEVYDQYKDLAVANNEGKNIIVRNDNQVYASLIMAYGLADRLKGGLKFLSSVQASAADAKELEELREVVAVQSLLPLALKDTTFRNAFDLTQSLNGNALHSALAAISTTAADKNQPDISVQAFDRLAAQTQDLAEPAMAVLAMHIRNANVEAGEPFWRILENATATIAFIEPTTMRTIALIGIGQAERGLRHSRRMFARIRDTQAESKQNEAVEQIDEAIELIGNYMLKSSHLQPQNGVELLRMMTENGGLVPSIAEHVVARLSAEHIARLSTGDLEYMTRVQAGMILNDVTPSDIAGPARFGCLLENVVSRSAMPSPETETMIEKALVNIDRNDLSRMWNNYRYPQAPPTFAGPTPFTPVVPFQPPPPPTPFLRGQQAFDDSFDPYAQRTDIKGSNAINEMLERPQGRRMHEALTKFRNMRRVGRVPRMFTYGKLIEAAAKENNLATAHEILELAKQDVPFDARYRVVRFGWQQILDHMVAGCLTIGRRDLAARYHQDLVDMGAAPSANTFGLYITTLKENTKTFDEASEAVKIFLRAKAESVEPSSFLYNALIGKLGKARRIDDCLFYFAEMRNLGIRPTSVTYGTIVNALCRVSDEKFAEEIFEEMESCANYKPRPAPYHSLMQFFLTTKRDKSKVLSYYERMRTKGIEPTVHTFKLLIDTYATLQPVDMDAAEGVLHDMTAAGVEPEAVHYASLVHAKGCVLHDIDGAKAIFDKVISEGRVRLQPCLYQAMFESFNANHVVSESEALLQDMTARGVEFTPYIANALIHGWTQEGDVEKAKQAFDRVPVGKREPSTYEAMVRAFLAAEDRDGAKAVVKQALSRGYPSAVAGKIAELVR
jgi:pentatricopeptide repeat protein